MRERDALVRSRPMLRIVLFMISVSAFAPSVIAQSQTSADVKVVPLGQVNNAQLRTMARGVCGPYFTMAQTDRDGLGFLNLAVDDGSGEVRVVSVLLGAVQLHDCKTCEQPSATLTGDASSYRVDLSLTKEQYDLSPCLKRLKFRKER